MHVRHPVWIRRVASPGARVFAIMFALESTARALLTTVITLQALALLQDVRNVSLLFSLVGVGGLCGSFLIPLLIRRSSRRLTYTLGASLLLAAALLLTTVTVSGQVAGMLLRVLGVACLSVTTSLYIMQYINRRDLTRSEPMRLQFAAIAWTVGPWAGVKLYDALGPAWAYGASAAAAVALLGFFWALRLTDNPAIQPATRAPANPFRSIGRFVVQRRLRLAWLITFGRSSWWTFFFIYTPLYMIERGQGQEAAALVVSVGNGLLFLTPIFGRLGARHGIRRILTAAFIATGVATFLAGIAYPSPVLVGALLLMGALGAVALDALGNIPFIRSVHPHERAQMTTVFRTYIDVSELLPPAVFALVLTVADLRAVFLLFGCAITAFALVPQYLPRRL